MGGTHMNPAISGPIVAVNLELPNTAFANDWRANADRTPIGSTVTIRTTGGKHITAVLYVVDDTGITIKPKTRVAEPVRRLTYDQIAEVIPHDDRVNIFKYIAI